MQFKGALHFATVSVWVFMILCTLAAHLREQCTLLATRTKSLYSYLVLATVRTQCNHAYLDVQVHRTVD